MWTWTTIKTWLAERQHQRTLRLGILVWVLIFFAALGVGIWLDIGPLPPMPVTAGG